MVRARHELARLGMGTIFLVLSRFKKKYSNRQNTAVMLSGVSYYLAHSK